MVMNQMIPRLCRNIYRRTSDFRQNTPMKFFKNKILLTALAILILIPTVVSVVYYNTNKDGYIAPAAASTLAIRDTEGVVYTFEKGSSTDADTMIEIFSAMESGAEKSVSLPDAVATSPSFTVTYSVADLETKYEYYLSKGAENAFYLDAAGNAFHIKQADAEKFLATSYAQSIYNDSKVPVLTLSGEYRVSPKSAQWMYKNTTGNFVAADTTAIATGKVQDFSLEGGFALALDQEADSFRVKVTNLAGEVLFDDVHANIGSLRLDAGTRITVEAEAKWFEDAERAYYGELSYSFTATVAAPAEFYPGVSTATVGEFVSLTAVNVKDPTKITFTSEPAIGYEPVFMVDESDPQYVRALVPFDVNLVPGTYVFTLSYAGTTQTINFELTERTINAREYDIDAATVTTYFTESAKNDFKSTTADAANSVSGKKLWNGYFLQGEDVGPITYGFGHVRTIASADAKYNHPGVDYSAAAGVNVPAANDGVVVYAGVLELTGYTVIIDHGFGLKTWYWHMSETAVEAGQTVARGDVIGKTGRTGFTNQNGVHMGMSVRDVFVSPYATWSDGTWADVPMYSK